jgi:hypothetical protein
MITRERRAIAAVTVVMAACVNDVSHVVSVEPAPTPGAVTFVLADANLVYGLTVSTCSGRALWTISNEQQVKPPVRITYGIPPRGFATRTGPGQLKPGCYEVTISGPSRSRFHIAPDGRLVSTDTAGGRR